MWKKFVTDYLSFTKKDRTGIMVLAVLIFIVVLLPYIWPVKKPAQLPQAEIDKIKVLAAKLDKPGTEKRQQEEDAPDIRPANKNYPTEKAASFYFDPNTLSTEGWKRLGIRDKTIGTIQHYLEKGGRFKKPEDLSKVYGLFNKDYERLLPYVQIKTGTRDEKNNESPKKEHEPNNQPVYPPHKTVTAAVIDINTADTTALIALPGIGSKLALRIINFRDKLGGFYNVQQLAETYGLPDSTFYKIKDRLQCNQPLLKQININTADANTLKQHPYIRWNLANVIVQYRNQHGNFKSVDDLQQITIITPEILQKVKPYLVLQ